MTKVTMGADGQLILSDDAGGQVSFNLGIVQVNRPQIFINAGDHLLALPDNFAEFNVPLNEILVDLNGAARSQISLQHQALEQSNVDLAEEMTKLLQVQRSYQFQARSITIADQMQGLINGIR